MHTFMLYVRLVFTHMIGTYRDTNTMTHGTQTTRVYAGRKLVPTRCGTVGQTGGSGHPWSGAGQQTWPDRGPEEVGVGFICVSECAAWLVGVRERRWAKALH